MDAFEGLVDFAKRILLRGKQAEGKIAVKCVRACVGHMSAETGLLIKRIFRQIRLQAEQFVTKLDQAAILLSPPGGYLCRERDRTQHLVRCSAGFSPFPARCPGLHNLILAQPKPRSTPSQEHRADLRAPYHMGCMPRCSYLAKA